MRFATEDQVLSYGAAIMDGEGSVTIAHHKSSNIYVMRVEIGQSEPGWGILDFMASNFNGNRAAIYQAQGNRKRSSSVGWSGAKAFDLLVCLWPFLIAKKKHAEIGISFQIFVDSIRGKSGWNDETRSAAYIMRKEIMALNEKGKTKIYPT